MQSSLGETRLNLLRRYIIRFLRPISVLVGKIHFAPKQRCIKATDINYLTDILLPGDVLLSFSLGELTNRFIEGEYKHCAIYAGDTLIIEAVGSGVRRESLEEFCSSKDAVAVVRSKFCSPEVSKKAVDFAEGQIGKPYDYGFEPNESSFYCAELIAKAYDVATNGQAPFRYREILGVSTVLPVDFKLAVKKFDLITERPV